MVIIIVITRQPDRQPGLLHRHVHLHRHRLVHQPELLHRLVRQPGLLRRLVRQPELLHRPVRQPELLHRPVSQPELLHRPVNQAQAILLSRDHLQQGHPAPEAAEVTVGVTAEERLPEVAGALAEAEAEDDNDKKEATQKG